MSDPAGETVSGMARVGGVHEPSVTRRPGPGGQVDAMLANAARAQTSASARCICSSAGNHARRKTVTSQDHQASCYKDRRGRSAGPVYRRQDRLRHSHRQAPGRARLG